MRWDVTEQDFPKDPGSPSKWCGQVLCDEAYRDRYGMTEQEYSNHHLGWPTGSEMIALEGYAWLAIKTKLGLTEEEFSTFYRRFVRSTT